MTTCLCSFRSFSFSFFLSLFTTSFPTSLPRQYPDLQSFPVQKIVNQTKHSGYQSVACEKSTCKDEECLWLQMNELCDVPQRHDLLRGCGNDAAKGTKTTRFVSLSCTTVFFFFFGQFCVVAKVAMIHRKI
jgi:hypothetical protein